MCTRPNFMIWTGRYTSSGRPKLIYIPGTDTNRKKLIEKNLCYIEVPCGKCLECRMHYCAEWSGRCVLEAKNYKDNYFVTLTYDDLNKPLDGSLNPDDLKRFLKALRNKFKGTNIKFFASGEYGTKSFRPHFHIILFNCPLNDLSYEFKLKEGDDFKVYNRPCSNQDLMFSQTIYDAWNHKGMISVGKFNYDTASYVAQYCMKKYDAIHQAYIEENHLHPEFIRMSRRPGIGGNSYDDLDVWRGDVFIPSGMKTHYASTPRYYEKLFIKKYGDDFFDTSIRVDRNMKKLRDNEGLILSNRDPDYDNYIREHIIESKFLDNRKI